MLLLSDVSQFNFVLVDSSGNGYTLWHQNLECISYNPIPSVDALIIVNRAYNPTGNLNTHEAPGNLSAWVHYTPYQQEMGPARYPNTLAGTPWPYIAFPFLVSGNWGGYGGRFEWGGWFSEYWPVLRGLPYMGDLIVLKELPDTMVLAVCNSVDNICYILLDPYLNTIDTGTIAINATYWGYDINGGTAVVFYFDSLNNLCYKTTTDGTNWSPEYTWDLAFTPPYPNDSIIFTQMALTDDGEPRLVFECRNLDDNIYPYYGKIYVSHTSGVPPVELTAVLPDTEATYPTIATGGGKAVVIFNIPRNDLPDSLTWMDIYMCISSDNGISWSAPINITSTSTFRLGLQQIAKRIDLIRNRIYYVFARDKVVDHDPLWHLLYDPIGLDAMDIFLGYTPLTGIKEGNSAQIQKNGNLKLEVYPDIIKANAQVKYKIPIRQIISLNLYDIVGRKIATIAEGFFEPGAYAVNHNFSELSSGTYFLILEGEKEIRTQKILILR